MPRACVDSAIRLEADKRWLRDVSIPIDLTKREVCVINATRSGTTRTIIAKKLNIKMKGILRIIDNYDILLYN